MELVIVVVIIGIIGAIAIPRFSGASQRSLDAALAADLQRINKAIDLYTVEHLGREPAIMANGSVATSGLIVVHHLTGNSDEVGNSIRAGIFGPYLTAWPANPINSLSTVRINGAVAPAGTHGWRYDTGSMLIVSDAGARVAPSVSAVIEESN